MTYTEADFDHLSWHDCHIWGVELRVGDPDDGDWTSELALDLDFIVEWICCIGGGPMPVAQREEPPHRRLKPPVACGARSLSARRSPHVRKGRKP
jgi:hypothetical protein